MSEHAFLDAYGDTGLDVSKAGTSTYFIVAAVLLSDAALAQARELAEEVRTRHFQTGEIKSKKVGDNLERRLRVLAELSAIDFHVHIDAIDKRQIDAQSGLIYKRSFLKYLHGQLYRKLVRTFPEIHVLADEHGSPEFMRGFEEYIRKRHSPELFPRATFGFTTSEAEVLVQVGDFMAGSLARVIDPARASEGADRILEVIGEKILTIDEWPPQRRLYGRSVAPEPSAILDSLVERVSLDQALLFIEENGDSADSITRIQVSTIRYLIFYSRFMNPTSYVPTNLILNVLRDAGARPMNEQFFRSSVIAKLRDAGVIIASGHWGYKLPVSARDLSDFVHTSCGVVLPMVARLKRARDQVLLASKGQLDILDGPELEDLRRLCNGRLKSAV